MGMPAVRVEVSGTAAAAARVQHLALVSYGRFTAMQVRDGRTRGLGLHLARLDAATRELFGTGLDGDLVRSRIRHALASDRDASVRVIVFWPDGDAVPAVLVTIRPPRPAQSACPGPPSRPAGLHRGVCHQLTRHCAGGPDRQHGHSRLPRADADGARCL
jgi:hypothetical protein